MGVDSRTGIEILTNQDMTVKEVRFQVNRGTPNMASKDICREMVGTSCLHKIIHNSRTLVSEPLEVTQHNRTMDQQEVRKITHHSKVMDLPELHRITHSNRTLVLQELHRDFHPSKVMGHQEEEGMHTRQIEEIQWLHPMVTTTQGCTETIKPKSKGAFHKQIGGIMHLLVRGTLGWILETILPHMVGLLHKGILGPMAKG